MQKDAWDRRGYHAGPFALDTSYGKLILTVSKRLRMNVTTASDQMAALSDPTRRQVFQMLAAGPSSVAEIAQRLPVSRPAVSQHLRVLKDARLVTLRAEGTRHLYQLDPRGVAALRDYLESLWQTALDQFKNEAERSAPPRKEKRR
jgi:DNA-binding transcriptional ArsR family regulator